MGLELRQRYQMVSGELRTGGRRITLQEGRLTGTVFTFRAAGIRYRAEVDGATMTGAAGTADDAARWRATRHP